MLTLLAILTGSRRGELCALRWNDVDAGEGVVRVRRALYRAGDERSEKVTKGRRGRWVGINDELSSVLLTWRAIAEKAAAEHETELAPGAFIVSKWPDGPRPINPGALSTFQARTAEAVGLKLEGRNPLGHFAGTVMAAEGMSPRDIANTLGHADPAFTLRRYSHGAPERRREVAAVLGRILQLDAEVPALATGEAGRSRVSRTEPL